MNASKFDRDTFERLKKHSNHTIQWFKEKYNFADDDEFISQLKRIYSDDSKVNRMYQDMKKREQKASKKNKNRKDSNVTIDVGSKTIPAALYAEKPIEITTLENSSQDSKSKVAVTEKESEVETLKKKLADNQKYLEEVKSCILSDTDLCTTYLGEISSCTDRIRELQKELADMKKIVVERVSQLNKTEKEISDNINLKKMLIEEIAHIEEQISEHELLRIYFGSSDKVDVRFDISANDVELDEMRVTEKIMELIQNSRYEEMPLGTVKVLAKYFAIIEKMSEENPTKKIEAIFDIADGTVINTIKMLYNEINIKVV